MFMLETVLKSIADLSSTEAENLLVSAGESILKSTKNAHEWKKILVDTGEFFIENEKSANAFFDDLSYALSRENMASLSKDLQKTDGYELKKRLNELLMRLMVKYEIPHELAESYCMKMMYVILEQIKVVNPDKYEHYFLQEWRNEQEECLGELRAKLEKMSNDIALYQDKHIDVYSSGQMDITLRRSTSMPSIGIDFFIVDDEHFQEAFEEHRYDEMVFVRGKCREETIYCILNELWKHNEKRPIYVVKSLEAWQKLQMISSDNNIYIPWFYADEIMAIENNTNIFVLDENTPAYKQDIIELRPRTHETLSRCLCDAGMESDKAYNLIADTHGLYIPMKKHLFRGEYLKKPEWVEGLSDKTKKICLLLGKWEEIEGDKLIIETLYEGDYGSFLSEILPYTKGEDPLLYAIKRNYSMTYYLASTENTWECLNISLDDPLWKKFVEVFIEILNESENLFTYSGRERLLAQMKGEKLFWSETIRKGMVKTLIMKGFYRKTEDCQPVMDELICKILNYINTEKQWTYISTFWTDLCEISPRAVLTRLEKELIKPTGLMKLFENQTGDFIFERNAYIDILWGIEQFLVQKEFAWDGFRWLLKVDNCNYEYKSNSPKDTFAKIFCTWYNFSAIRTSEEKILAAKLAMELSNNSWMYLYEAMPHHSRSMVGKLSEPKYRDYMEAGETTIKDMQLVSVGYLKILLSNMDFSVERWEKLIKITEDISKELRKEVFDRLLYEITQMTDCEIISIKNSIREIIYHHRYFASSSWAMSEKKLNEYEQLLEEIHTNQIEYEYGFLFLRNGTYPLLNPVPYNREGERADNERETEELIHEKIVEFQNNEYQLKILAELSARDQSNSLGEYLAKYWKDGKWDFETFEILLKSQPSGMMAIDYMSNTIRENVDLYPDVIAKITEQGYSDEILSKIYRTEASWTENMPLICNAAYSIKVLFWKSTIWCKECNARWAVNESKKYANFNIFLHQMYQFHHRYTLSAQEILSYFENIESMSQSQDEQLNNYYIQQFLEILQKEFLHDDEKCFRVSQIEILFMNLLEWDNMKCFHHMIKKSPELFSQLVASVFKRDNESKNFRKMDEQYLRNMYTIYDKAHFCPAEENGEVSENKLQQWVEKFKILLKENDQSNLFTSLLGRLFSFSPTGKDGHEPCEAVRTLIEKYLDDKLLSSYVTCVFNRRGVYSPSAGKAEMQMAQEFKSNAEYLQPRYPKTAKIFYRLYDRYKSESERERKDAENGWY